jgi:hypothetical protein
MIRDEPTSTKPLMSLPPQLLPQVA